MRLSRFLSVAEQTKPSKLFLIEPRLSGVAWKMDRLELFIMLGYGWMAVLIAGLGYVLFKPLARVRVPNIVQPL